jgi:hypothetical protein
MSREHRVTSSGPGGCEAVSVPVADATHTDRYDFGHGILHDLHTEPHRWYVAGPDADRYDFGGVGFDTLAEAKADVRRRCSCTCGAGPFGDMTTKVNHEMSHDDGWGHA